MDNHKFCFIICSNNELYLEECIHYINNLAIPQGYEVDLISISEAQCMTKGYNEGMHASDAKYKIYMHQDVYILNKRLLFDLLEIFESSYEIGMVGVIGYKTISSTGMMWDEERFGELFRPRKDMKYSQICDYQYSLVHDGYEIVALVDGLLMATCVDIEWETEELTGWDFYDAYQSLNFIEEGYKVVVPIQRLPWVMHDDGVILNLLNYDQYRQKFRKRFNHYLGKSVVDIFN